MQKVYTKIESIVGNVVTVRASGVRNGDLALVGDSYANVIKLDKDLVTLQVFSGTQGVSTTDPVRFLGRPMMVSFSDHLLGRIFDGAGVPRDNGPALTENMIPIGGPSVNPSRRIVPNKLIRTGIPMIDVFNTLVESQKLPIFSVSGEPYNQLLSRIAMQAQVDVIVLGGMGLKYDDYLYFRDTLEKSGAMGRTVMFIHTASDPTVECTLVPDMALAVAEQFALAGKRVLVLLTDMTNYADAQKEMAITMEQVPSNRGYPGDLYSCLAARYEKAVDFEGAGSITILGVTTMPGDDVTHPVPDNTGYITEGQYYLKNGHIEPFGSLSRLKQNVNDKTRSDHRALMDGMIRLYSAYKESLEKKSMGFMMSEWDEKLLKYGHLFETKLMDLSVNIPLEEALDLADVIIFMDHGRIVQMAPPEEMLAHPASGLIQDFLGKFINTPSHKALTAADFMRTGVYTVSLHRGTNECVRKMQRYNVDTLIVVDDAGRYAGTVSIADIRLNGHVVTDIAPLVRTATPTVHSGDDAKGCFEQLISSGASYLVVLGEAEQVEGIITKTSMASAMAEQLWG